MRAARYERQGPPQDVIFAGLIGTGKSHLASGLGIEPARRQFGACNPQRQLMDQIGPFGLGLDLEVTAHACSGGHDGIHYD